MIVAPGAQFTADAVIEAALRQDIGPDKSLAAGEKRDYRYASENIMEPTWEYKKKYRDKTPMMSAEAFDGGYNRPER